AVFGNGVRSRTVELEQLAQVVVRRRGIGPQFDRPTRLRQRLGDLSFRDQHARLVLVRFGKSRVDSQRFLEMRARSREVLAISKYISEIVVRLRIYRSRLDCGVIVADRGGSVLDFEQVVGVGVVSFRKMRLQRERTLEFVAGFLRLSGRVKRL